MNVVNGVISPQTPLQSEEALGNVHLREASSSFLFFWKKVFFNTRLFLSLIYKLGRQPFLLILFLSKRLPLALLPGFSCSILDEISSPATRVFFPHNGNVDPLTTLFFLGSKNDIEKICLKMWQGCNNGLYYTEDISLCTKYLLEGLEFNRRFASDVYLGIASVEELTSEQIRCGGLIAKPNRKKLKPGKPYVLIMERLEQHWRLDHQLKPEILGTKAGMEFLAREVACMHRKLSRSPEDQGKSDTLLSKLTLNRKLFNEALTKLGPNAVEKYKVVSPLMGRVYEGCVLFFEQRYGEGHIKRCHGDLKATNLWVRPLLKRSDKQLITLDCVDFRPEFCHIDTLSDIAMLAVDIEMRLTNWLAKGKDRLLGKRLAAHFLRTYLHEIGETTAIVWPLLEYYMTEKAMICAYMSILYDGLPTFGTQYMEVALTHAKRLDRRMATSKKLSVSKEQTTSVVASYSR